MHCRGRAGVRRPFSLAELSLAFGLLLVLAACSRERAEPEPPPAPLRLAISGLLSPAQVASEPGALDAYFGALWKRPVTVTAEPDAALVAVRLGSGELDAAIFSPLRYVIAQREVKALEPSASIQLRGADGYPAVLVARRADELAGLESLRGKRVCWVETSSTSGYLYPRALLRQGGVDPDHDFKETLFTGSHDASLDALRDGRCDVAATFPATYEKDGATFVAVGTTATIPFDPVVFRPGLDPELHARLRAALLAAAGHPAPLPAVLKAKHLTGYSAADASRYAEVQRILAEELAVHTPEEPF